MICVVAGILGGIVGAMVVAQTMNRTVAHWRIHPGRDCCSIGSRHPWLEPCDCEIGEDHWETG